MHLTQAADRPGSRSGDIDFAWTCHPRNPCSPKGDREEGADIQMRLVAKDEFQNRTTFSFHMCSRSRAGPGRGKSRVCGSPRRPAEFRCRVPGGDPRSLQLLLSIAPFATSPEQLGERSRAPLFRARLQALNGRKQPECADDKRVFALPVAQRFRRTVGERERCVTSGKAAE